MTTPRYIGQAGRKPTVDEARAICLRALFAIDPSIEAFMATRGLLRGLGGSGERDGRPAHVRADYEGNPA